MLIFSGNIASKVKGIANAIEKETIPKTGLRAKPLADWTKMPPTNGPIQEKDTKTKESGLQRYTGIKKYGKDGFEALQKAGREGASEEEKGAIKDKYLKKKK